MRLLLRKAEATDADTSRVVTGFISYLPLSYLLLRCPGFEPPFLITLLVFIDAWRVELALQVGASCLQSRAGGPAGGAQRRDAVPLFLPL